MIAKTQMTKSRKPAFKWVGLQGAIESLQEIKNLVKATQQAASKAPERSKEPPRKYAKTADPSPQILTPNLMKLQPNTISFRGFADGLRLGKAFDGSRNEEFKSGELNRGLIDTLSIC